MSLSSVWTAIQERTNGFVELALTYKQEVLSNILYLYDKTGGHGGLQAAWAAVDVSATTTLLGTLSLDREGFWLLEISGAVKATADYRDLYSEFQAAISSALTLGTAEANVIMRGPLVSAGMYAFDVATNDAEISFYARVRYEVTAAPQSVTAWCLNDNGPQTGTALCRGRFIATYQGRPDD